MMINFGHNEGSVAPMAAARAFCLFEFRLSPIQMADKDGDDDRVNNGANNEDGILKPAWLPAKSPRPKNRQCTKSSC